MCKPYRFVALGLVLSLWPAPARELPGLCGTYRERVQEDLLRHRISQRHRREVLLRTQGAGGPGVSTAPAAAARDLGPTNDLAVIDTADGVVSPPNQFNLDIRTLTFTPAANASRYKFAVAEANTYDFAAAAAGTRVNGLGDDDTRQVPLPFSFPFFGKTYGQVFVNSDGNLTFLAGDTASTERSLGRMTAGPPRIAPLFRDLDPGQSSKGVSVLSDSSRFVVTWAAVPEFADTGTGPLQTFQLRLYPDGRIEFAYNGISTTSAVVGIAPGNLTGSSSVVHFLLGSSQEFSGAVGERFGTTEELDLVTVAQKFYETHDDAYDYLVIFNRVGIVDSNESIASERTVRNARLGTGDLPIDAGREFGSARRLQSVINMGELRQYGRLDGPMPARPIDTPLTVLAHEAGHLFLAYASVRDPQDPHALPMLGFQNAHWSFNFNSDASLVEGNRIQDKGAGITPRFLTTGASQGYSPLDQYLMGLRAPEEVQPSHELFYVANSEYDNNNHPRVGVSFNGDRRSLTVADIIAAEGRRTPDHTVAPRTFRFAFIFVVPQGGDPTAAEIQKLEDFRHNFETYFQSATSDRATAETELRRAVALSLFPGGGVLQGGLASVTVAVEQPAEADLRIALKTANGYAGVPGSVTIPAGKTKATFTLTGLKAGVDELAATPSDPRYETAQTHIQVAASAASLKLAVLSGVQQFASPGVPLEKPVVLQVVDQNNLPYPGVRVKASVTGGGSVTPSQILTDETGTASFAWTPGAGSNRLTASIDGASATVTVAALGVPAAPAEGVVNAASFQPGLVPGSLASIFGVNLSAGVSADATSLPWPKQLVGVQVKINGTPVPVVAVRDLQVNFLLPSETPLGPATLIVSNPAGASAPIPVTVSAVAPGVFYDPPTGRGAILRNGEYVEIYATGLGSVHPSTTKQGLFETDLPVKVFIGSQQVLDVPFAGLAPGFVGLYQVNAKVPPAAGTLSIEIGGKRSNAVKIP